MRNKLLILAGLTGILLISGFALHAQQQIQGLRATPISFELNLQKGLQTKQTIHLDNLTGKSVTISVSTQNFTAQGEQGGVTLTSDDTPYSLAKWITVSPSTANLKPNERKDFEISINVPANAEPGGHFGSVVFSTVPPKDLNTTGALVTQSVGALILGKVPGLITENADIESFKTSKSFYEFGPVDFSIRVKNNSNVHVKPIGVITVINTLTGEKSFVGINGNNVLPGAIRQLPATWSKNLLIGKYVAYANLSYGSKSLALSAVTEFTGFPVRFALVILVILIILFILRKRLWKAFKVILRGK